MITTSKGAQLNYPLSLDDETLVVGNDPDCGVFIPDKTISDDFAEIKRVKGGYYISVKQPNVDTIIVSGSERTGCNLSPLAPITIGSSVLNIVMSDEEISFFEQEKPPKVAAPVETPASEATAPEDITILAADPPTIVSQEAPQAIAVTPIATAPAPRRAAPLATGGAAQPRRMPVMKKQSNLTAGFFATLLFICAIAVFAGMFLRHYKEKGTMLTDELLGLNKNKPTLTPPTIPVKKPDTVEVVTPKEPEKPDTKKMVVSEADVQPQEEDEPTIEKAVKSKGNMKLPTLDEFLIP